MARSLYLRRIQRCAPIPAECGVCRQIGLTFHFDCDLLSRVGVCCIEDLGCVEIELWAAEIAAPNDQLAKANP